MRIALATGAGHTPPWRHGARDEKIYPQANNPNLSQPGGVCGVLHVGTATVQRNRCHDTPNTNGAVSLMFLFQLMSHLCHLRRACDVIAAYAKSPLPLSADAFSFCLSYVRNLRHLAFYHHTSLRSPPGHRPNARHAAGSMRRDVSRGPSALTWSLQRWKCAEPIWSEINAAVATLARLASPTHAHTAYYATGGIHRNIGTPHGQGVIHRLIFFLGDCVIATFSRTPTSPHGVSSPTPQLRALPHASEPRENGETGVSTRESRT